MEFVDTKDDLLRDCAIAGMMRPQVAVCSVPLWHICMAIAFYLFIALICNFGKFC